MNSINEEKKSSLEQMLEVEIVLKIEFSKSING